MWKSTYLWCTQTVVHTLLNVLFEKKTHTSIAISNRHLEIKKTVISMNGCTSEIQFDESGPPSYNIK